MKIYQSAEDYLETILFLQEKNGYVRSVDIAQDRGLSKPSVSVAMNVMLYGMFIAIVVPVAKKSRPVLIVAAIAIFLSSLFYYVPFLKGISAGISIILCTVAAAAFGAVLFPVSEEAKA